MKVTAFASAAVLLVGLIACVLLGLPGTEPVRAAQPQAGTKRPLVFVPGLLGSMLCRPGADGGRTVVWGTLDAMGQFPSLALAPGQNDIEPCGLIREVSYFGIFSQDIYGPFIDRLVAAGYRDGETLFVFDYDWRLSVLDNADRLAAFIDAEIPTGAFDVVAHSMGGLVARTYAANKGENARIARLISAGSPWRGSVQVFELLRDGWGLANGLLGGIEVFRRNAIGFPSTFEMVPHYDGCCDADRPEAVFDVTSLDAWSGLNWPGIDRQSLPDLSDVEARQKRLREIVERPLPPHIEEALVIGVDQRTPQQYQLALGAGEAQLSVRTSWEGDGTVMLDSALLAERPSYSTSFAAHDAILSDPSVQDFVIAVLSKGAAAAVEAVPVRKRTSILTALGELVELVGVSIATDQPVYPVGATVRATVHLRLDTREQVDTGALRLTVTPPGGAPSIVPLVPDPSASDPSTPLEQSFSAEFGVGMQAGDLALSVSVDGPEPRVVTRELPVLVPAA